MKDMTTIVIADDHPMFRGGVRQALERDVELKVVAEAGDGATALRLIQEHRPQAAVLDINMPKMSGLEVARALSKEKESPAIVLLTMFDDEEMLNEAMDLGVKAYLLKESASVDVSSAVHAVIEGRHYVSPSLTDKLLQRTKKRSEFTTGHPKVDTLNDTERKILKFISESKTSKEIADELFLSPKTVDNYRFKISEKLNLHGSYSLLKFALENKKLL
jgi:two-component system, NarL family, response regulator DegU